MKALKIVAIILVVVILILVLRKYCLKASKDNLEIESKDQEIQSIESEFTEYKNENLNKLEQ